MTAPDLAAFLLARIAEDEADARNAIESGLDQWGATGFEIRFVSPGSLRGDGLGAPVAHGVTSKPVPHMARHDPARVLAECAALRAVVEQYVRLNTRPYMPEGHGCGLHPGDCFDEDGGNISDAGFADYLYGPCAVWERVKRENPAAPPEATLRLLAQPFADHPAFDPAWRLDD